MEPQSDAVQSFPFVRYRSWLSYVATAALEDAFPAALAWFFLHLILSRAGLLAFVLCGLLASESDRVLGLRNKRVVLDAAGVTRKTTLGFVRQVARWDLITGLVWSVSRGPLLAPSRLLLEITGEGGQPRRVRLWGGHHPDVGGPIRDAIIARLGLRDVTDIRPQSALSAFIAERKEYAVWRR